MKNNSKYLFSFLYFKGCYWHGHHDCDKTKNMDPALKKQRYERTLKRQEFISANCTSMQVIWECEYLDMKRRDPALQTVESLMRPDFYNMHKGSVTMEDIKSAIINGEFYGFIECDISCPDQWNDIFERQIPPYEYFCEMSPLFCTVDVDESYFGEHMKEYMKENNLQIKSRRLLVGGMKAEKILLHSKLAQWYLNHGMEISRIYEAIEFIPSACFKKFTKGVTDARKAAQLDPKKSILAQTQKCLGNSAYGSLLLDREKHKDIQFVQGSVDASFCVNDTRFKKLIEINSEYEYYEVEKQKKEIKMDVPYQIGFTILQLAKLRMLEFYYDFLDYFFDRKFFELLEMDTDSFYFGISKQDLEEMVKPERQKEFHDLLYGNCYDDIDYAALDKLFIPRRCCDKHQQEDSRVPSLFKLEYSSKEMISLNSKCYIAATFKIEKKNGLQNCYMKYGHHIGNRYRKSGFRRFSKILSSMKETKIGVVNHNFKISCKGVSKRKLKKPLYIYRRVMKTKKTEGSCNIGFQFKNQKIVTYKQNKMGFGYFYCKRQLLDDGVHTQPLSIILRPIEVNVQ